MAIQLPLTLDYWLVSVFSGSVPIFVFISVIVIAGMAARFGMQNMITLSMLVLWIVMLAGTSLYGGVGGLYLIAVLVVGLVAFYGFSKLFKT